MDFKKQECRKGLSRVGKNIGRTVVFYMCNDKFNLVWLEGAQLGINIKKCRLGSNYKNFQGFLGDSVS